MPRRRPRALADGGATDGAGDAEPPPVSGSPFRALALSTGLTETCALLDNHRIKCWGANIFGSLGNGGTCAVGAPAQMGDALPFLDLGTGRTATALSSGRYHSCAILDDGSVKCWGYRTLTGVPLPPAAEGQVGVGDEPGEMGDALPALDLGAGRKATQIACGYDASCALLDDGTARCWSDGPNPLPVATPLGGTSQVRQLAAAKAGVVALFEDGTISKVLPWNTASIDLSPGEKATFVAGGGDAMSLCAILDGAGVRCAPSSGAGLEATTADLTALGLGLEFSCGLSRLGDVRCWGFGDGTSYSPGARLSDGSAAVVLGRQAVALTGGNNDHMCALLADGSVKCWGTTDLCKSYAGTATCPAPTTPNFDLGSSVDATGTSASCKIGAWHAVNLGAHP
jgi:Regulator of chromosome condensation (RCC1) repeat